MQNNRATLATQHQASDSPGGFAMEVIFNKYAAKHVTFTLLFLSFHVDLLYQY